MQTINFHCISQVYQVILGNTTPQIHRECRIAAIKLQIFQVFVAKNLQPYVWVHVTGWPSLQTLKSLKDLKT